MKTSEVRDRWICWEIDFGAAQDRGERIVVHFTRFVHAAEAAEAAAAELVSRQISRERWGSDDLGAFDQAEYLIDVEAAGGPRRFAVRVAVKLEYTAEESAAAGRATA